MANFQITGGPEIVKVLNAMPRQLQRKALVNAFRAGANIVRDEAKRKAPNNTLRRAITVARGNRRNRPSRNTVVMLALRKPASSLAHLFEFGTQDRRQTTTGRFTGRMTATPFLRPALDTKAQAATNKIAQILKENLMIIARQLSSGSKISLAKKNRSF